MASAKFRIATATINSAGTTWYWRSVDTPTSVNPGSYVKTLLESRAGVSTIAYTIKGADVTSVDEGLPTVTTVTASKTATFRAGRQGRTYLIECLVNGSTSKRLAVHVRSGNGAELFGYGEVDEADRTHGHTGKLNHYSRTADTAVYASTSAAGEAHPRPLTASFALTPGHTYLIEATVTGYSTVGSAGFSVKSQTIFVCTTAGTASHTNTFASEQYATVGTLTVTGEFTETGATAKCFAYPGTGLTIRLDAMVVPGA